MLGRLTQKKPHWPQLVELVSRSAHTPLQHTSLAMGHWYAQNPQLRPHWNEPWALIEETADPLHFCRIVDSTSTGRGTLPLCHTCLKPDAATGLGCPEGKLAGCQCAH